MPWLLYCPEADDDAVTDNSNHCQHKAGHKKNKGGNGMTQEGPNERITWKLFQGEDNADIGEDTYDKLIDA